MSNFKNVLKVYTMMRAFDADDTALLNTLRNATEAELGSLAEAIGPVKRATKRPQSEKCGKCGYTRMTAIHSNKQYGDYHEFEPKHGVAKKSGKSPRAASLAGAISGTITGKAHVFCVAKNVVGGGVCNMLEDNAIHDPTAGYAGYHPFQSAVAQAAAGGD